MADVKADSLRVDCLLSKPQNFDWSEGYGETWEVIQPYDEDDFQDSECPECEGIGEILVDDDSDEWIECEKCKGTGEIETDDLYYESYDHMWESNQPMMNYYYPLPDSMNFDSDDAKKIEGLNLCLVYFMDREERVLALTGGGMDLSWDICAAYIQLGFYPPVHFRLPNFAGMENSEHRNRIINACLRGREIVKTWMDSDIRDLEHVRESLATQK